MLQKQKQKLHTKKIQKRKRKKASCRKSETVLNLNTINGMFGTRRGEERGGDIQT